MNREFVYINDDTVAVSNDSGKISIRKAEHNMKNVLVSEDKLDSLDTTIHCAKKGIAIEKKTIELINKWYKVMGGASIVIAITSPFAIGLLSGLGLTLGWLAVAGASCAYGKHVQNDSARRINGHRNEIRRAKELKVKIHDELDFDKELAKDIKLPHEPVGEVVSINHIKEFENQDRTLNYAFYKGYKEKPKTLVKTRSPLLNNINRK